jgi:hypothetical protein
MPSDIGNLWKLPVGADEQYTLTMRDNTGKPITTYAGTETFPCTVWSGETLQAVSGVLSASWRVNPPIDGQVVATISGAGVLASGLQAGFQQLRVMFAPNVGKSYPFYEGWIELGDVAGVTAPGPVYCTLTDMYRYAGDWIQALQSDKTTAGFLSERARARQWLDQVIVSKSRRFANRVDITLGNPWGPVESWDWWIQQQLDSNLLVRRPVLAEITARKAIGYSCEHQMSWEDTDLWERRARYYHKTANNLLLGYRCEIDLTGANGVNGSATLAWNLGVSTFR